MSKNFSAAAGLLVLATAFGQSAIAAPVTYNFTGSITSGTGIYPSTGTIAGTFTLDYAAANPAQSVGSISTSSAWTKDSTGGSTYSLPAPAGAVFAASIGGAFTYEAPLWDANVFAAETTVGANDVSGNGAAPNHWYTASFVCLESPAHCLNLSLQLRGTTAPYDSAGLPVFSLANVEAYGYLQSIPTYEQSGGQVSFTLNSLAPVPLPAAVWLLMSGLGGVAAFARRRRLA